MACGLGRSTAPAGDFSNPPPPPDELATARPDVVPRPADLAKTTVDDAQTTATKKVHVAPDGTRTLEISPSPVRFKDAAGKWQDIDLAVTPGPDGTLGAKSSDHKTKLSPQAEGTVAVLETSAGPIGLRHPQVSAAPAATKDRRASYKGALGGRDLALDLSSNGVEETVTLADRQAATTYLDEFTLPAGVTAKPRDGGGVTFADAAGAEIATFAPGLAFDSAGPGGGPGTIGAVSVRLVGVAPPTKAPAVGAGAAPGAAVLAERAATATNVATVEVSVDEAWAKDKARTYPVQIDPLFTYVLNAAYNSYDGLIVSGGTEQNTDYSTNANLAVGSDNGARTSRSLLWFNVGSLAGPGTWVTEAHLSIWNWASGSICDPRGVVLTGLGGPITSPVTWNRQPPIDAGPTTTTNFARYRGYGCGEGFQNLDATNLAQRWLMNGSPNYGLQLRA
ncbi:MAG: DNRLRE domain-containing protein [Actinomycetota bacterium]|nr:DNRLRE domain-containing protein [Actinomycetota bacterium]